MDGLFITGTDTEVGKTHVAAAIAAEMRSRSVNVGVYKPIASGCRWEDGVLVSDDALTLWDAAGRPGTLARVCPQRFVAPLAPDVAAAAEGKSVDEDLLVAGAKPWQERAEFLIVEGAGGLLSPLSRSLLNADVAAQFGYPLIVVAANRLGVLNHTLLTLSAATNRNLPVAGVILSDVRERSDESSLSNFAELKRLCEREFGTPLIDHLKFGQRELSDDVDWP